MLVSKEGVMVGMGLQIGIFWSGKNARVKDHDSATSSGLFLWVRMHYRY